MSGFVNVGLDDWLNGDLEDVRKVRRRLSFELVEQGLKLCVRRR